jgi:hypothetical protein
MGKMFREEIHKEPHVDGIVDAFLSQYRIHGDFMINYMKTQTTSTRQQHYSGLNFHNIVYVIIANAGSNDYLRISARSGEGSLGAGGTTKTE